MDQAHFANIKYIRGGRIETMKTFEQVTADFN